MVTRATMLKFYYGSMFVKKVRINDIYIGIVAEKLGIPRTQIKSYMLDSGYKLNVKQDTITAHYNNHYPGYLQKLVSTWKTQNKMETRQQSG